ncbi:hypothetical protein GCM10009730_58320 [Streptomyces albidochromogenes]
MVQSGTSLIEIADAALECLEELPQLICVCLEMIPHGPEFSLIDYRRITDRRLSERPRRMAAKRTRRPARRAGRRAGSTTFPGQVPQGCGTGRTHPSATRKRTTAPW